MSAEGKLGAKKLRLIERLTGIKPDAGWARHPYWEFRDGQDRHFILNTQTGTYEPYRSIHYTSCPSSAWRRG